MRGIFKRRPSPSMIVAIAALVVAVAGTAIAGPLGQISVLNKKEKKQTRNISKQEIKKAAPGLSVAKAVNADRATDATNATNATNATTVGGHAPAALGRGVVLGSMDDTPPGAFDRSAFGPSNTCATVIPCVAVQAPTDLLLRDFRAAPDDNVEAGESLVIQMRINGVATALCTATTAACTNPGPISIPNGATFILANNGQGGLEGNEEWSFAYRLTPP